MLTSGRFTFSSMKDEGPIIFRETSATDGTATSGNLYDRTKPDSALRPDTRPRKTYFSYVNRGASQGNEVRHWLTAEAQLAADRVRLGDLHRRSKILKAVRQSSCLS